MQTESKVIYDQKNNMKNGHGLGSSTDMAFFCIKLMELGIFTACWVVDRKHQLILNQAIFSSAVDVKLLKFNDILAVVYICA